jgi:hypothetical protein
MFEKIAKFRLLRARRAAPDRSAPANDNRRGAVDAGRRRPQLVCRWSFDQGPHCSWEIAGPQRGNPLLADEPRQGRIHTTVFVLSYDGPGAIGSGTRPARDRAQSVAGTSLADSNR